MDVRYIADRFETPISEQAHGNDPSYRVECHNGPQVLDAEYFDTLPQAQEYALRMAEDGWYVRIDTAG